MAKKIIKVKIKKEKKDGATQFTYPKVCQDNNHSQHVTYVAYEADASNYPADYADGGKIVEEYAVGVIEEGDVFNALVADDDIEEMNETDANTFGKTWKPQVTKITDEQKVILILAKEEKDRTQEEKDALDPENEEEGINKTPEFNITKWL